MQQAAGGTGARRAARWAWGVSVWLALTSVMVAGLPAASAREVGGAAEVVSTRLASAAGGSGVPVDREAMSARARENTEAAERRR